MERIAIAGFGREGRALLRFLKQTPEYHPPAHGVEIWILDKNSRLKLPRGTHGQLGEKYLAGLEKFDTIFRSPGIPYECTEFRRARTKGVHPPTKFAPRKGKGYLSRDVRSGHTPPEKLNREIGGGVKFSSATKLFFAYASRQTRNIIGITGTKGKSTTSTLLYNILRAAKKSVFLAGNIGMPMLDLLPKLKKHSIVILELSSFQIQDLEQSPPIAIVLDIFPDHQNSHRNLNEYYAAKSNIARFQKKGDNVFYFPHNIVSRKIAYMSHGNHVPITEKENVLFLPNDLKLKGAHNYMNVLMASRVASTLGVPRETIRKAIRNFHGLPHRLEFVRSIRVHPVRSRARREASATSNEIHPRRDPRISVEVIFWNDSASSNPGAAAAAVRAFHDEAFVFIAGGKDKNLDYRPLAQALKRSPARAVVLYGENKGKIAHALTHAKWDMRHGKPEMVLVNDLKSATHYAYTYALSHISVPIVHIVLSPGSASFDMFKNFEERGNIFKKIACAIK